MTPIRVGITLLATAALAACASNPQMDAAGNTPAAAASETAAAGPMMRATLVPAGATVSGDVRLEPGRSANEVRARVRVQNGTSNAEYGWEIRTGPCGDRGQILGPQAAYRSISIRPDGNAEITANLPIRMPATGTHHVNITRSRTDDTPLACGVLSVAR